MNKKILFIFLWTMVYFSKIFADTTIPGGYVSGNWTAAGSPYLVQGNITIQADSTLNIEPGVEVNFQGHYTLTVNGFLQAIGAATDSIHFTASTDWEGINFTSAPDSSHLEYCILDSAASFSAPLYCQNSNPVISHCTIRDNSAFAGSGGIQIVSSNPRISYCTISNNSGIPSASGGISISGSSPEIYYCSITGNYSAGGEGGGIYCEAGSTPLISHCTITGNSSKNSNGGGIAFVDGSGGTITDCFITADSAYNNGGGIYISSPGGVVNIINSTISDCLAMSDGGGIYIHQADTVSIVSTIIDANLALLGGAMYSVDCNYLFFNHCDVVNNVAPLYEGGIWLNGNTNINVKNSIFKDQVGYHIYFQNYSSASVTYSDFSGPNAPFSGGPTGLGSITQTNANGDSCDVFYNIYLDPLFVDFPNGDYHLTVNSPCIDAGDPASTYDPDGTITDMGRYYFDQGGTGIPGGYVSGTWTAGGSPYRILGNIIIHADSTLIIEPGVVVDFQNSSFLQVNGLLEAVGTETDSILFTGTSWLGITFENAPDSSHLTYCIVRDVGMLFLSHGGITCMNSNPVISHSRISNNQGQGEWGAGGIMLYNNSNANISRCNISNNAIYHNFGGSGGGIKIRDSHPTITGCTISDNYGDGRGGGIDMLGSSSLDISNCTITGNVLYPYDLAFDNAGGGIASQGSDLTVTQCTISHNVGGNRGGGGIWISGGDAMITNCTINNNNTVAPAPHAAGGGIYADCDTLVVDHCTFVDNFIGDPTNFVGFSINAEGSTSLILINSIIKGRGFPDRLVGLFGASASITYSDFYLYRNAFVGNLPTGLGELTQVNANGDSCDVYGNIFLDPLFADAVNSDYHLSWANWPTPDSTKSPCIDAGNPTSPYDPDNTVTDMGVFYFNQNPTSIKEIKSTIPSEYFLSQNYPNPFNPSTTIFYQILSKSYVKIELYNILGERVKVLFSGNLTPGNYTVNLDGGDLPSGVYYYRLTTKDFVDTKKCLLLK
jgi:hypothetical protein